MTYNEAETRFWLIDPVLRGKGFDAHWKLKLETPAHGQQRPSSRRCRPH